MMTCREISELVSDYVEEELPRRFEGWKRTPR